MLVSPTHPRAPAGLVDDIEFQKCPAPRMSNSPNVQLHECLIPRMSMHMNDHEVVRTSCIRGKTEWSGWSTLSQQEVRCTDPWKNWWSCSLKVIAWPWPAETVGAMTHEELDVANFFLFLYSFCYICFCFTWLLLPLIPRMSNYAIVKCPDHVTTRMSKSPNI